VEIDVETLEELDTTGAASVSVAGVATQQLRVTMAGGGAVVLAGLVGHLDATLAGSAKMLASELDAQSAKVSVEGTGHAEIFVEKSLTAAVVGAGTIRYDGRPSSVERKITGAGDISPVR
jgi:hypothetical protein